ncbi:MAG: FmdB family zinc ribbon protein [candidate division WOR-3 bacterium]
MPTYEYHCHHCGHRFERFQGITEPPVRRCPKCRRNGRVERLISGGSGLVFKGSGFYITDYCRKSKESPTDTAAVSGKSGEKTPESKPSEKQ